MDFDPAATGRTVGCTRTVHRFKYQAKARGVKQNHVAAVKSDGSVGECGNARPEAARGCFPWWRGWLGVGMMRAIEAGRWME